MALRPSSVVVVLLSLVGFKWFPQTTAWSKRVAWKTSRPEDAVFAPSSSFVMNSVDTPTDQSSPSLSTSSHALESVLSLTHLPKLLVFDLDNTLWTPELYQIRQRHPPRIGKDIRLFPDALTILEFLALHRRRRQQSSCNTSSAPLAWAPELAIASRTNKAAWAHQLLEDFAVAGQPLRRHFEYRLIQTGSKRKHFEALKEVAAFRDMLFYDDDARLNLGEVSQLGVLCCHTPRGITVEHFVKSLQHYHGLKQQAATAATINSNSAWMGYVLNHETLNIDEPTGVETGRKCHGRVKFYSPGKKFGFVVDDATGQELFVHESKVPSPMRSLQAGDRVVFEAVQDPSGRSAAVLVAFADNHEPKKAASQNKCNPPSSGSSSEPAATLPSAADGTASPLATADPSTHTRSMPCFSMSQPFVALLLNGFKTVESRNNPMFADIAPGTRVLVHCGQRDWHDATSFRQYLDDREPPDVAHLPRGFSKGCIVGAVTIGKTWKSTARERDCAELQRRVLAPAQGIGTYCTEVADAQWLKRPIKMRGSPGIYQVEVQQAHLP